MNKTGRLLVLYASQTFTAQEAAERIWRTSKALGFRGPVQAMDEYPISKLINEEFALFICATTGQGDEPDNMKKSWKFLLRKSLPSNSLAKLKFGVLGFGDSSFPKFNFVAKKLFKRLLQLGATPLLDAGLCDYQHDLGHEAVMQPWLRDLYSQLSIYFPDMGTSAIDTFIPRWSVSLLRNEDCDPKDEAKDIYFKDECSNAEGFPLEVDSNVRTTAKDHFQDVRLIGFQSTEPMNYKPGDVFNIRPRNSKEDVDDLFSIFETHNLDIKPHYNLLVQQLHEDMPVPYYLKPPLSMRTIAEQLWDLRAYPSQYVFSLLANVSQDKLEKDKCRELSSAEGQEDWLNFCRRPKRTILEVLHDFHKSASQLTITVLFELFSMIKPRSYSIASFDPCQTHLELLVAVVKTVTRMSTPRLGLCSNWLKELQEGQQVYGWIKHGSFKFPEPPTPYIMVGPGTGLAPFRSLIQQQMAHCLADAEHLHLFYGCRNRDKDFHCGEELERAAMDGKLSMYCAYSRDQERKIYVQHRIAEHAKTLWRLINNGGHIFISGNSKNMPDNVKEAFADIVESQGGLSKEDSQKYIKDMETKGLMQLETW